MGKTKPDGILDVILISLAILLFLIMLAGMVAFVGWLINETVPLIPYISVVLFIYLLVNFFLGQCFAPFGMMGGIIFYISVGAATMGLTLFAMWLIGSHQWLIANQYSCPIFAALGILNNFRLYSRERRRITELQVNSCY